MIKQTEDSCETLDLSKQGIKKLPKEILNAENVITCLVDDNDFSRLEGFDQLKRLRKLSAKRNRLVKISGLSKLCDLVELDLSGNALQSVENLKSLRILEKLNLADNNIKSFSLLSSNQKLRHLDLSNNGIANLSDISSLRELQTLDLSKNIISSISSANKFLPESLVSLDLTENEIGDLCEIACLHFLNDLEYLGFTRNKCVSDILFDYRPYIANWCCKLKILDGKPIMQTDRLKAEWLFSQGHGRRYSIGCHEQLVEYLMRVCPLAEIVDRSRKGAIVDSSSPAVREAWVSSDTCYNSIPSPKKSQVNMSDMMVEEVSNIRESIESSKKIQSESVFIPLAQAPINNHIQEVEDLKLLENVHKRLSSESGSRPLTAPSGRNGSALTSGGDSNDAASDIIVASKVTDTKIDSPLRHVDRPKTSPGSASSVNKYEEYESRPCRPMSKQLMKELFNEETAAQRQQTVTKKPALVSKPSPSAGGLAAVPEKLKKESDGFNNAKTSASENVVAQQTRFRARRGRVVGSPGSGNLFQKSSDTTASAHSKNISRDRAVSTPELPRSDSTDRTTTAVVRLQAAWRGFLARKKLQQQLRALAFRRYGNLIASLLEMRKADAEHIRRLEETLAERDRQERRARRLQTAAIKQLWEQVQTLKQKMSVGTDFEKSQPEMQSMNQPSDIPSVAPDENVSSAIPTSNDPLASIVSDSLRSVADVSFSPANIDASPTRRETHNLDFGITRRSPYAVRQTKALGNPSPSTPGKSVIVEDINRAAALSPLATPPRTRQTAIGNGGQSSKGMDISANGDGRKMALAAKFSYLPNTYRSSKQNGAEDVSFAMNNHDSLAAPSTASNNALYERVREKLSSYQ